MKEVERKAGALMEVLRAEEPRRIAEAIVKTDNWDWDWVIGLRREKEIREGEDCGGRELKLAGNPEGKRTGGVGCVGRAALENRAEF